MDGTYKTRVPDQKRRLPERAQVAVYWLYRCYYDTSLRDVKYKRDQTYWLGLPNERYQDHHEEAETRDQETKDHEARDQKTSDRRPRGREQEQRLPKY